MNSKITYHFSGKLWRHSPKGGWYFITIPKEISDEIRENLQWQEEGWGRMKASAIIKEQQWNTSIWFDTKKSSYLLPVKADIRNQLSLVEGDELTICILI